MAFWFLVLIGVYVYAGYPLFLLVTTLRRTPLVKSGADNSHATLIISCFNERPVIASKIENSLALVHEPGKLEIVVVSDASDDGSDEIVQRYAQHGVQLIRMSKRGGKTAGLNAAADRAHGELLVFSDANAMYPRHALRSILAPFADQSVGAVIGASKYADPDSDSARSESLYWKYESTIKKLESRRGSVVGGDGAIYAVRRQLYQPMNADDLSDFVNPLQVVESGYRCVYEPEATSIEEAASDFRLEFRRKTRIVNRAWRAVWRRRSLLNPFRYGSFSIRLWSHKVLRWLVPFIQIALMISNVLLLNDGVVYVAALILQGLFYGFALVAFLYRKRAPLPSAFYIPLYFCLVNAAAAVGLIEAFIGKSYTTWSTVRADNQQ